MQQDQFEEFVPDPIRDEDELRRAVMPEPAGLNRAVDIPTQTAAEQRDTSGFRNIQMKPTWSDTFDAAEREFNIIRNAMRHRSAFGHIEDDPDWEPDREQFKRITEDVDPRHFSYLMKARSEEELLERRRQLSQSLDRMAVLDDAGIKGVGAGVLASLIDPTIVPLLLVPPLAGAHAATRLGNVGMYAAEGSVVNIGIESVLMQQRPTGSAQDILYAGIAGAALGGLVGSFAPRALHAARHAGVAHRRGDTSIPTQDSFANIHADITRSAEGKMQRILQETLEAANINRQFQTEGRIIERALREYNDLVAAARTNVIDPTIARAGRIVDDVGETIGAAGQRMTRGERTAMTQELADLRYKQRQAQETGKVEASNADVERHLGVLKMRAAAANEQIPARKLKEMARAEARAEAQQEIGTYAERIAQLEARLAQQQDALDSIGSLDAGLRHDGQVAAAAGQRVQKAAIPEKNQWIADRIQQLRKEAETPAQRVDVPAPNALLLAARNPGRATPQGAPSEAVEAGLTDSVGAARNLSYVEPLTNNLIDVLDNTANAPRSSMTHFLGIPIRWDAVGRLGSSPLTIARYFGLRSGKESVGLKDGGVAGEAASEWQNRISRYFEHELWKAVDSNYPEWFKHNFGSDFGRFNPWKNSEAMQRFGTEVDDAIRFGREVSPEVQAVADNMRRLYDEYRQLVNNPWLREARGGEQLGPPLPGFGTLMENPNYVPRLFSTRGWSDALFKYGDTGVSKLYAGALRSAQPHLSSHEARVIADAITKKVRMDQAGMEVPNSRFLSMDSVDDMRTMLLGEGVPAEMVEKFVKPYIHRTEGSVHARGKSRATFDESFEMQLPNRQTGEMENARIIDLYNRDAVGGFLLYNRQMSGQLAMHRIGISSRQDLGRIQQLIDDEADQLFLKDGKNYRRRAEEDKKNLEYLYDAVTGTPLVDINSPLTHATRMTMDWNFSRVMGQAGFAQLSELGNAAAELGLGTMIRAMPSLRSFIRDAKTGRLKDELSAEMELWSGLGGDLMRSRAYHTMDEYGNPYAWNYDSAAMRGVDIGLQAAKKLTHMASMGPMNVALHRMTTRGIAQRFFEMAVDPRQVPKFKELIRRAGLTDDEVSRLLPLIKTNATKVDGTRKLMKLNIDQWNNPALAEKFAGAVQRIGSTLISEPDPGQLNRWMLQSRIVRLMMQFRSFMFMSHASHFLRNIDNIAHGNWRNFAAMQASMFTGAMGYIGQSYIRSIGDPNGEEWLAERLSSENLAPAVIQRSSWAAFAPMVWDTINSKDKIFNARSTGLSSDLIFGNPTFDLVNSISSVSGAAMGSGRSAIGMGDYEARQQDANAFFRVFMFQNIMGVENVRRAAVGHAFPD